MPDDAEAGGGVAGARDDAREGGAAVLVLAGVRTVGGRLIGISAPFPGAQRDK